MALSAAQSGVLRGMAGGALVALAVPCAGWWLPPLALPATTDLAGRLAFALRWDLLVIAWVIAAIGQVAAGRFFSRDDITGAGFGPPSPSLAIDRAVLQNTLEQAAIAIPVHLALATLLPAAALGVIPLLVLAFCAGRLAFCLGYAHGAAARSFGFAATFYPTVLAALLAAWLALAG